MNAEDWKFVSIMYILRKEFRSMYNDMMNAIPDFVHVLLSWLEVIFGSVLEYLGIIKYPSHEGTNVDSENATE